MTSVTLGVDTGGTFTDVILRDAQGKLHVHKLLSTPEDPSIAIEQGARALLERLGLSPAQAALIHGTTVAMNALLERRGARVALITTAGHEDVLFLRRQHRPQLYALQIKQPEALVDPADCIGVDERMSWDGQVLTPLEDDEIARVVARVKTAQVDAVAISLLHAYADPTHEARLARALRAQLPDLFICTGAELSREPREYERASTAAVNAYVGPMMRDYLERLIARLPVAKLEIFLSSGALGAPHEVIAQPVHTTISGPAGGVVGALTVAKEAGFKDIIAFDMGGTSTDVSLCRGELAMTEQARIDGLPLQIPLLDLYTVGAGGGSIAMIDVGGALRVGPRSAGAAPGPAAYGRGGSLPTVTDAHVVLGRLRPDRFLGGELMLDVEAATRALEPLASAMGVDIEDAALGILRVADASMVRAIKVISLERGHDPRDFALVSFGGAGGLHACRLAEALELNAVIVPRHPGLLSAYGMIHAQRAHHAARTLLCPLCSNDLAPRQQAIAELAQESYARLGDDAKLQYALELRYKGQSFTLAVPVPWSPVDCSYDPHEDFQRAHERLYGWSLPQDQGSSVELVSVRVVATLEPARAQVELAQAQLNDAHQQEEHQEAEVWFEHGKHLAWIRSRESLVPSQTYTGPGVITEYSGTTIVPPRWSARLRAGHIVLTRAHEEALR